MSKSSGDFISFSHLPEVSLGFIWKSAIIRHKKNLQPTIYIACYLLLSLTKRGLNKNSWPGPLVTQRQQNTCHCFSDESLTYKVSFLHAFIWTMNFTIEAHHIREQQSEDFVPTIWFSICYFSLKRNTTLSLWLNSIRLSFWKHLRNLFIQKNCLCDAEIKDWHRIGTLVPASHVMWYWPVGTVMVKTQWGYLLVKRNKSVGLLLRRAEYPRCRHVVILYLRHNSRSSWV